jgi:hypothetical protein
MVPGLVAARRKSSSSSVSKLTSSSSLSKRRPAHHGALEEVDVNLKHCFDLLHQENSNNQEEGKNWSSSIGPQETYCLENIAVDVNGNDDQGTTGVHQESVGPNPDETLADLSSPLNSINDIMEWQEILNSVAKEEEDVRDEDVALLGNCDSEDEEDLDGAFVASHAERMRHLEDNEAVLHDNDAPPVQQTTIHQVA